jgi:aldehyde dehydrogenase (NAD+)
MTVADAKKKVFEGLGLEETVSGVFHGEWMPVEGRKVIESVSPIDGSVLGAVAQGEEEDYERVMAAAAKSCVEWSKIPSPRRGEIVGEIGQELLRNKELLGLLVTI